MATYEVGDESTLAATFKDAAGTPTDPTAVTLKIKPPSGSVATHVYGSSSVVRDSAGAYHFVLALTATGTWHYRWVGTGTLAAAGEGFLSVRSTVF